MISKEESKALRSGAELIRTTRKEDCGILDVNLISDALFSLLDTIEQTQEERDRYKDALERIAVVFDRLPIGKIAEQALGESRDTH